MPDTKIPVSFKFGQLSNLPAAVTNGTIYVTTDERAIYGDFGGVRIRIGDFQAVANLSALPASAPESALFFVEDINVLARWNGESWTQINRDTGATAVTVSGNGNAVTAATYDAATRTITLTKGVTFAVPDDITSAIANLDLENTYYGKDAGEADAAAIDGILDGTDIDSFGDVETALAGKQDIIPDNTYDEYGAAADVLGAAGDDATDNTVYGAKAAAADALAEAQAKVASVTAGNDGIEVGGTSTAPTISLKLSSKTGNSLIIETADGEEGLYLQQSAAPVITVAEKASPNTGYLKTYQVCVDGVPVSMDIDIPKDFLVKSATSGVVTAADKAAGGKFEDDNTYSVGDAYLDFVINVKMGSDTDEHVYVNVSNLVDVYTNGNGLNLSNNEFSIKIDSINSNGLSVDASGLKIGLATDSVAGAMSATDHQKLHEHANKTELDLFVTGDKNKLDTAATKAAANETAIDNIKDGDTIDSFGDVETALAGKQDTIPANTYDAYGAATTAKNEVIGTASDTASDNTVNGAKAYADSAISDAIAWGSF